MILPHICLAFWICFLMQKRSSSSSNINYSRVCKSLNPIDLFCVYLKSNLLHLFLSYRPSFRCYLCSSFLAHACILVLLNVCIVALQMGHRVNTLGPSWVIRMIYCGWRWQKCRRIPSFLESPPVHPSNWCYMVVYVKGRLGLVSWQLWYYELWRIYDYCYYRLPLLNVDSSMTISKKAEAFRIFNNKAMFSFLESPWNHRLDNNLN